jgi:hypothetical protein
MNTWRRIFLGLGYAASIGLWTAHAQETAPPVSQATIAREINVNLPDNSSGYITAALLRATLHSMNASYGPLVAGATLTAGVNPTLGFSAGNLLYSDGTYLQAGPSVGTSGAKLGLLSTANTASAEQTVNLNLTGAITASNAGAATLGETDATYTANQIAQYVFCTSGPCDTGVALDAVQGVGHLTLGSTIDLVDGVGGYVVADQASGGVYPAAVGVISFGIAKANSTRVWGYNANLIDDVKYETVTSGTGKYLYGTENDFIVTSPNTTMFGYLVAGGGSVSQPNYALGFDCGSLDMADWGVGSTPKALYTACFNSDDWTTAYVMSIGRAGGKTPAPNLTSQTLLFGWDSVASVTSITGPASPAVVTWPSHGFSANQEVGFASTVSLPAPLTPNTPYYVVGSSITTNTFEISATPSGTAIVTTGASSGTLTGGTSQSNSLLVDQYGNFLIQNNAGGPVGFWGNGGLALKGAQQGNESLLLRGHQTLSTGVSLYSVNDAGSVFEGLEINAGPLLLSGGGNTVTLSGTSVIVSGPLVATSLRSGVSTNSDLTGSIALSGGTNTYSFAGTYTTAPNCFTQDVTTPTNSNYATTTTTVLTLHGTSSDTIKWICVGLN